MNGKGNFKWKDGREYSGDYVNDMKEGYGTFTWPDKRQHTGFWKNGK
jgi:hypothetical protein